MIIRQQVTCFSCKEKFIGRFGIEQSSNTNLIFPCPNCNCKLECDIIQDKKVKFKSHDFQCKESTGDQNEKKLKKITIYTEIPSNINNENLEINFPFMQLIEILDNNFDKYYEITCFFDKYFNKIAHVNKKICNHLQNNKIDLAFKTIFDFDKSKTPYEKNKYNKIRFIYIWLTAPFFKVIGRDRMYNILSEYYQHLNNNLEHKSSKYQQLLNIIVNDTNYQFLKKNSLNLYLRYFNNIYAFFPAIIYDLIEKKDEINVNDYKIYRNDFDYLKSIYLDTFEIVNKYSYIIGTILNLSIRNDYSFFSNEKTYSFKKFSKLKSFEKLKVYNEIPIFKDKLFNLDKDLRNNLGHFSVSYDYLTSSVIYENGKKENYILFLYKIFELMKVLWFLIKVTEKIEHDYYYLNK